MDNKVARVAPTQISILTNMQYHLDSKFTIQKWPLIILVECTAIVYYNVKMHARFLPLSCAIILTEMHQPMRVYLC